MDTKFLSGGASYQTPSLIKDPFLRDKIGNIFIHGMKNSKGIHEWGATVNFNNGNTSGQQRTGDYEDFDAMMVQLKAIFQQINEKSK